MNEVTAAKLRGGFYSPSPLVQICLDRAAALLEGDGPLRVLEPTAGDGAFLSGLACHQLAQRIGWVTGVEIVASEAALARNQLEAACFDGEVVRGSFLRWAAESDVTYDLAVGNPPFVRFQFVDPSLRAEAESLAAHLGITFRGVSNLWQPVLLGALGTLRSAGVFAFIVPAEIFTGISGHDVREWLLDNVVDLHVDVFDSGSFPQVLQEVVVLSGIRRHTDQSVCRTIDFTEHGTGTTRKWQHSASVSRRTWTRYLLTPTQLGHLDEVLALPSVTEVGALARFEVATVTGANAYFCVDDSRVDEFGLAPWARPLLPRTRHAPGLIFTEADHQALASAGLPAHLLDFCAARRDPVAHPEARRYLGTGESSGLPRRYKCSIRDPWYRVPVTPPGELLLAKRSHHYPRVIVNDAGVVTTDTIYRGSMLDGAPIDAEALAASFHNSLTQLTAEIEGRSFGGGVLELVPSEISRLSIPVAPTMSSRLASLDELCRRTGGDSEAMVDATDDALSITTAGLSRQVMDELRRATDTLKALRLARNYSTTTVAHSEKSRQ